MKTTEAIEFLKSHDVTDDQGYNILIEDLYDVSIERVSHQGINSSSVISPDSLNNPVPQALIQFFMYQIQSVLFPVIRDLRTLNTQLKRGGEMFKAELDESEKVQ